MVFVHKDNTVGATLTCVVKVTVTKFHSLVTKYHNFIKIKNKKIKKEKNTSKVDFSVSNFLFYYII